MNSSQKLNQLMLDIEHTSTVLLSEAIALTNLDHPWKARQLLTSARAYADAMRALRNEHRNAKRRAKGGAA